MRILIYGINYAPEIIGVGKYTGEMGEWLAERGQEVRMVTAPPYYPEWQVWEGYSSRVYKHEHLSGVDVWRCPLWVPKNLTGAKRLLHLASFAVSSIPIVLSQVLWRPDAIIVIEPPLFSAPLAWLTARLSGAHTWLHVQDFELDAAVGLGLLRSRRLRGLLGAIERMMIRGAARVSTITRPMQGQVVKKGIPEDRTSLFPNWSNTELVRPLRRDNDLRSRFGAGPDDVLALYAGNMGKKQGLDLVLDAAERLKKRPEVKFAMIGNGSAREELRRTAVHRGLDNVRFFPVQPLEGLPFMLAAGDIHLVVQRREAADLVMPSKLTNILAAGRPSIATADPGTALYEVLNKHHCGITTPPGSAEDLSNAIVRLTDDPQHREHLGMNARKYAEAYLNKDEILARFEKQLRSLVGKGI